MKLHLTVLETVKRADPVSEASSDCVRDNGEGDIEEG